MVKEEPTRETIKRLKAAGFVARDAEGSHTKWVHEATGTQIILADGHRRTSPGVVRKVNNAIKQAKGE